MKILFYGACHVHALSRILKKYSPKGSIEATTWQNYTFLRDQTPFPLDQLTDYDAIVFNPLFTRGEWNTDRIVERCRQHNIRTVSMPVVEWRGYFTGISKGNFGAGSTWHYPGLFKLALGFKTFQAFETYMLDEHLPENALSNVDNSNAVAKRTEELGEADVLIADYVAANYRSERLFLTPLHPTRALYVHIVRQVTAKLGIEINNRFFEDRYEPQAGFKDPILPGVRRALKLQFVADDFQRPDVFGDNRTLTISDYLRLYYYGARDGSLYEAKNNTALKLDRDGQTPDRFAYRVKDYFFGVPQFDEPNKVRLFESSRYSFVGDRPQEVYLAHLKQLDFLPKNSKRTPKLKVAADVEELVG